MVLLPLLMVEAAELIVDAVGKTMGCAFWGVLVRWLTGGRAGGRGCRLGKGEAGGWLASRGCLEERRSVAGLFNV